MDIKKSYFDGEINRAYANGCHGFTYDTDFSRFIREYARESRTNTVPVGINIRNNYAVKRKLRSAIDSICRTDKKSQFIIYEKITEKDWKDVKLDNIDECVIIAIFTEEQIGCCDEYDYLWKGEYSKIPLYQLFNVIMYLADLIPRNDIHSRSSYHYPKKDDLYMHIPKVYNEMNQLENYYFKGDVFNKIISIENPTFEKMISLRNIYMKMLDTCAKFKIKNIWDIQNLDLVQEKENYKIFIKDSIMRICEIRNNKLYEIALFRAKYVLRYNFQFNIPNTNPNWKWIIDELYDDEKLLAKALCKVCDLIPETPAHRVREQRKKLIDYYEMNGQIMFDDNKTNIDDGYRLERFRNYISIKINELNITDLYHKEKWNYVIKIYYKNYLILHISQSKKNNDEFAYKLKCALPNNIFNYLKLLAPYMPMTPVSKKIWLDFIAHYVFYGYKLDSLCQIIFDYMVDII